MSEVVKCKCKCGNEFTTTKYNGIRRSTKCPQCVYKAATSKKPKAQKAVKSNRKKAGVQRSRKAVEKALDDAWSYLVKLEAGHKCEFCGAVKQLNSHHINSRGRKSTRWNTKNGICLCVGHHIGLKFSAHKTPRPFIKWLDTYRDPQELDLMEVTSNMTHKYQVFELEIMLEELNKRIKDLE